MGQFRFLAIYPAEGDEPPQMCLRTEEQVSRAIDMADCDAPPQFLYLMNDGQLLPVSVGPQTRIDTEEYSFYYASAPLLAGGQEVGTVVYTDH